MEAVPYCSLPWKMALAATACRGNTVACYALPWALPRVAMAWYGNVTGCHGHCRGTTTKEQNNVHPILWKIIDHRAITMTPKAVG